MIPGDTTVQPPPVSEPAAAEAAYTANLRQRVITALIGVPIAALVFYLGGWAVMAIIGLFALLGGLEFFGIARGRDIQGSALIGVPTILAIALAFFLRVPPLGIGVIVVIGVLASLIYQLARHRDLRRALLQTGTLIVGVFYIGYPAGYLTSIRALPDGLTWVLIIFACTWGTDTSAYFGGRWWGRTPFFPSISPKKTREGAIVGLIGGALCGLLLLALTDKLTPAFALLVLVAPVVATLGDLLESAMKRFFRVKDSAAVTGIDLLPGHGGILDRTDSLVLVLTLFYFFLRAMGVLA